MIYSLPLFKNWKSNWIAKDGHLAGLISSLEQELAQRNQMLPTSAKGDIDPYINEIRRLEKEFGALTSAENPSRQMLRDFQKLAKKLVPLVQSSAWVRWLDLEKGLSVALYTENLLSATVITRSLAEEAMRGIALAKSIDLVEATSSKSRHEDLIRAGKNFIDWGLPRTIQKSVGDLSKKARTPNRNQDNKDIDLARIRLNDYVHPNYGSHRVAYDPWGNIAPKILCECLLKIYGRLNSNTWLNPQRARKSKWLQTELLAELDIINQLAVLATQGKQFKDVNADAIDQGLEELTTGQDRNSEIYEEFVGQTLNDEEFLLKQAALLGTNPPALKSELRTSKYPFYSPETTSNWAISINQIHLLESQATADENYQRIVTAINLFTSLSTFKKSLIKPILRLVLALKLPLSSSILCRSLLEYHAVAKWVNDTLQLETQSLLASGDSEKLSSIEALLSSTLIGSRSTEEDGSLIRDAWLELFGTDPVSMDSASKNLPAPLAFEYDLFSHSVHGTTLRGGDLLGGRGQGVATHALARTISVFAQISDVHAVIAEIPFLAAMRLSNLQKATDSGISLHEASNLLRLPESLEPGRDFTGQGTRRDPYQFRDGLHFHEAFYLFCSQNSIEPVRQLVKTDEGKFLEELRRNDGDSIYFVVDSSSFD